VPIWKREKKEPTLCEQMICFNDTAKQLKHAIMEPFIDDFYKIFRTMRWIKAKFKYQIRGECS